MIVNKDEKLGKRRKTRIISEESRNKILNAPVLLRERVLAGLFVNSGLRISDITAAMIENFDWDAKTLIIPTQKKTNKPAIVILTDRMISDIRTYILEKVANRSNGYLFPSRNRSKPLSERQVKNIFDNICKEAKVTNVTPHDLRATFITRLGVEKTPSGMVSTVLGTSLKTIMDYYEKYTPEEVREAFKRAQKE